MRVVILTNRQANQIALSNKIAEECNVAAIVFSANIPQKKPSTAKKVVSLLNRIAGRTVGREFIKVWFEMQRKYESINTNLPDCETIHVTNINDAATLATIEKHQPDLIIVSGTNLVGKKIVEAAQKRRGIVNLHTGISPYVKGGPNCTNWCLAKNWFHLIGSTIMWLDLGIDTGNIIATEQTILDGNETLFDLHWKVMEHGEDLYVRAIKKIANGETVPSIPQKEITKGTIFYTADWNALAMQQAAKNFRENYSNYFADKEKQRVLTEKLKLFPM